MSKTSLTVEKFREGEEQKFLINSPKEIQLILQAIAQKKSNAMLYINEGEHFIKTVILAANARGIWLDLGPSDVDNESVLLNDTIMLVTMHQGAKVQFTCQEIELATYASLPAFFCPLPAKMVRLQRREYFRLLIPVDVPLKCVIPPKTDQPLQPDEITIMDISVGGIALVCKEQGVHLEEGEIYPDCQIDLPGIGMLTATLQVKNLFDVTSPAGNITKHAGCEFVHPDGPSGILLQRFVALMQSKTPGL
jgi:c-di-GMP-binding flagellar brake protein YcgR